MVKFNFTTAEREETLAIYGKLRELIGPSLQPGDEEKMRAHLMNCIEANQVQRDVFGNNPILQGFQTALIVVEEIGLKRDAVLSILLHPSVESGFITIDEVKNQFGEAVARILHGLQRIAELYEKTPVVESENFRDLLLSFAEDMRVILIMIASRVNLMRQIRDTDDDADRRRVSQEAAYLYAPLAHKLGLYKLKSELEDLSLKYLEHDAYYHIREKLNSTKAARDAYIARFIGPIEEKLKAAGLHFHMKGRTKSIHSIWQKMKKQKCGFEGIYDLFAIRIILDSPLEKEKMHCWQVYSIVTDMYQPNPKRLRDWLSVPKSNGYESLHITVMGPEGKWVEVQIRTERMDEIAERGLAAHWRYKGVKGESGLDEWLTSVREALESNDAQGLEAMDQFKMDLYEDEVFVFTPKGDLFKLGKGSTVLDFAFAIHSRVGCRCIGAKVNGRNVPLRQKLQSGDQVEIMTSNTQTPKQDWLNVVTTSKARTKIRQALKEIAAKQYAFAKETLERKFKNRKIDYDESIMMRLIKRMGYKVVTDFYQAIADETLDVNLIIDRYVEQQRRESDNNHDEIVYRSAEGYNMVPTEEATTATREDVLVIDQNLKGIDFTLARCCSPIYGDDVFGFVSVTGGIKIHRCDCPNATDLRTRFGYRIVKARWAGKGAGKQYPVNLRVVGHDDIGIVTNLTSIISKESGITLRGIAIDSNDGLFAGTLTIMVDNTAHLETLVKKLRTVKGVKQVERNNI